MKGVLVIITTWERKRLQEQVETFERWVRNGMQMPDSVVTRIHE